MSKNSFILYERCRNAQTSEENLRFSFSFLYFTCKLNTSLSFEKEQFEDINCDLTTSLRLRTSQSSVSILS